MPEYRIRLLTTAETGGLQQTQQATDKLKESTKDLNAEMAKATQAYRDAQQPVVANAAATQKAGDAMDDAGKKGSRLAEGLKKAQAAVPGLGFALGSLTNLWTLLAAAVVGVVSKINEWDAVVKNNEARLKVFRDLNKEVTRFSENLQQAKVDMEAFSREVDGIRNEAETPEQEGARTTKSTQRRFGAQRELLQAQQQLELDKIARREASGELTPAQAEKARLAVGQQFGARTTDLDLREKAELAFISRRVAGAEGGRAAQLAQELGQSGESLTAAKNRRDDARRAFEAALAFGGLDKDLKPVEGGRAAEIEAELQKKFPKGTFDGFPRKAPDAFKAKERLRGELESLRSGALTARERFFSEDAAVQAEQERFQGLRSAAPGAERAARRLGAAALEQGQDFTAAAGLAVAREDIAARSRTEREATIDRKEAARIEQETAQELKRVVQSLHGTLDEVRGLRQLVEDLQRRSRSNIQHD